MVGGLKGRAEGQVGAMALRAHATAPPAKLQAGGWVGGWVGAWCVHMCVGRKLCAQRMDCGWGGAGFVGARHQLWVVDD